MVLYLTLAFIWYHGMNKIGYIDRVHNDRPLYGQEQAGETMALNGTG